MPEGEDKYLGIRNLKDGDWYWIHKVVIQQRATRVGVTAIAVYNFLASMADARQSCFPSQKYIARSLGFSRPTICKAIKVLKTNGLIRVEKRNGGHCVYRLLRVRCDAEETGVSNLGNWDVNQGNTNNSRLNINNNNNAMEDSNYFNSDMEASNETGPDTREESLALELAEALGDQRRVSLYLAYARKYPESFLREVLGKVQEVPDHRIRKGRGAFLSYLVKKYGPTASQSPGY